MMVSSNSVQGGRSRGGLAYGRCWEGMLAGIVVGLLVLSACSGSSKYFHDAVNGRRRRWSGNDMAHRIRHRLPKTGEKSGLISNAVAERRVSVVKCEEVAAGPMS